MSHTDLSSGGEMGRAARTLLKQVPKLAGWAPRAAQLAHSLPVRGWSRPCCDTTPVPNQRHGQCNKRDEGLTHAGYGVAKSPTRRGLALTAVTVLTVLTATQR
jgi:hypothetical protein